MYECVCMRMYEYESTGYTHSDEITLIFPKCENEESVHMHNGKIMKLVSLNTILWLYRSLHLGHLES